MSLHIIDTVSERDQIELQIADSRELEVDPRWA